ncbi:MAG: type IV toxin-antitoxin system AbiEi family antitoxin [Flavobacteriales bacterium]|nr:type IV toxin-antitoxin system AbiEi family antitoxin [Flavobacteriales bacterium]
MTLTEYISELQSYEQYSFSWEEILLNCSKTEKALRRELSRLVEKKDVLNLRKGFYLIIPPRYSHQGMLPIQLYVDKLFKYIQRPYYLGFYTAAKFHGAGHQQIQKDYVKTLNPTLEPINRNSIKIQFLTTSSWLDLNIQKKKSDAGYFNVSSPALTAIDLIDYQTQLGGLNRMLAILEELIEEISEHDLSTLMEWYPNKSSIQRLGYLFEYLDADEQLLNIIANRLKEEKLYPVFLSPKSTKEIIHKSKRWKVKVNLKLESDHDT